MDNPLFNLWESVHKNFQTFSSVYYQIRTYACTKFAWAVPNSEAIDYLSKIGSIIEIGAGRGYWASLIENAGGNIICFDECPPNTPPNIKKNYWFPLKANKPNKDNFSVDDEELNELVFTEVLPGGPEKILNHQNHILFLCWPPYDTDMAYKCLLNYQGSMVIYVGEGSGGCTGDDSFHEYLDDHFELIKNIEIPRWHGIHDSLCVYKRNW